MCLMKRAGHLKWFTLILQRVCCILKRMIVEYKRMEELTIEDLPSYSVILKFKEGVPEADRSRLLNKLEREYAVNRHRNE